MRERLQVVGVVVPLNAGPSSRKIHERDGLGARGVTISHNYRLATLTFRPTPVGSNRRQLSCISIRCGLAEYWFFADNFYEAKCNVCLTTTDRFRKRGEVMAANGYPGETKHETETRKLSYTVVLPHARRLRESKRFVYSWLNSELQWLIMLLATMNF